MDHRRRELGRIHRRDVRAAARVHRSGVHATQDVSQQPRRDGGAAVSKLLEKMAESDRRIIARGDRFWAKAYKVEVPFWNLMWLAGLLIAWMIADAVWDLTPL